MKINLLTPTGARPAAFSLCEKWIQNQTVKNFEWICVDDCPATPTRFSLGQKLIKAPKLWTPEINTQRYNMDALLEAANGDVIFIIEDDEYYAPNYVETMLKLLETASVAGISNDRYYHIKAKGYKIIGNWKHASLCRTALRKDVKNLLYQAVHSGEYYFDIDFWKRVRESQVPMSLIAHSKLSIGIKGMPGRGGLGAGHEVIGYAGDKDYKVFQEWLGSDWAYYQQYLK